MRRTFLAFLLAASRGAAGEAPPPEVLDGLDFFESFAEVDDDGLWEEFDVVSSTAPLEDMADDGKEEVVP